MSDGFHGKIAREIRPDRRIDRVCLTAAIVFGVWAGASVDLVGYLEIFGWTTTFGIVLLTALTGRGLFEPFEHNPSVPKLIILGGLLGQALRAFPAVANWLFLATRIKW